jgi:hypothetical protein
LESVSGKGGIGKGGIGNGMGKKMLDLSNEGFFGAE